MATGSIALRVRMSALLRETLDEEEIDPEWMGDKFAEWKGPGAAGEIASYYFGRDTYYRTPQHNGQMVLRHAHMPPGNAVELAAWRRFHRQRRPRTSDSHLIYAQDPLHGYLLLMFVREPNAHTFAQMATPSTARRMRELVAAAAAFIHDGSVVL